MRKTLYFAVPPGLLVLFFAFLRMLDRGTEPEPERRAPPPPPRPASVNLLNFVDVGSTGDLYFGQNGAGGEFYKGELRDVAIWERGVGEGELLQEDVPQGAVALWPLETRADNLVRDASGNGNHGTMSGGISWSESPARRGLLFDGSSGSVRIPCSRGLESSALTVSCWVKRNGNQVSWANLVRRTWHDNTEPTFISWSLQLNPGGQGSDAVAFNTGFQGGFHSLVARKVIPDGQWVRVVGVYDPKSDGSQKRLYVNGAPVESSDEIRALVYDAGENPWRLQRQELVSPEASDASSRLVIAYTPPEEYDLTVVALREKGKEALHLGLRSGPSDFAVVVDGLEKEEYKSGIDRVDGRGFRENTSTMAGKLISNGRRFTLKCMVRKRSIQVLLDDRPILQWQGDPAALSTSWFFRFPRPNALYIGAWESIYRISELRLDPVVQDPRRDP